MADHVEVYEDAAGEYRWRRKAENGEIVSDSAEGYADRSYCIARAAELNSGTTFVVIESHPGDELTEGLSEC